MNKFVSKSNIRDGEVIGFPNLRLKADSVKACSDIYDADGAVSSWEVIRNEKAVRIYPLPGFCFQSMPMASPRHSI